MPATNNDVLWAVRAAGIVTAFAVLSGSALSVVAKLSEPPLHVGDIVKFEQLTSDAADVGSRLLVQRSNQFGCVLDLAVMHNTGGSLVVESLDPAGDRRYRLHWAGQRTSDDSANCGSDAELIVDARELVTISLAANRAEPVNTVAMPPN